MIREYRLLVEEIAQETGVDRPTLLEADAPVLEESALREKGAMYLVGLIGGKDVGKSSLVNALVGQEITDRTSYGPGTEIVIAYAHEAQTPALKELLDREAPDKHRIVTHRIDRLYRQVLLDLPDIDSHYAQHIEVTRRMLRHVLYPIWLQSVEKYADHRPRELLAMVSAGNTPRNFIFCLNKVDQVIQREGEAAVRELGHDYAQRITQQLTLDAPPRVWLICAIQPEQYDLPDLRKMLSDQKPREAVELSQQWAQQRQGNSLADWIQQQDLEQRLAALQRLEAAAEEELATRVGLRLVDRAVPGILDDPAYRLVLADELMQERVARWPIVNVLHVLIGPLLSMLRLRLPVQQQRGLGGAEELVDVHLREAAAAASPGQSVAGLVQGTFAFMQQSSPLVSRMYSQRKLWESPAAEQAEANLKHRLADTVQRQRSVIRSRFSSRGTIGAIPRIVLTIGAVVWFPFAQPILQAWMGPGHGSFVYLVVQVLGVSYLLKNVAFLAVYFVLLWLVLKWDTQRRVDRWLGRWKAGDSLDPTLNLAGQVAEWSEQLLDPIRTARRKMRKLLQRAAEFRKDLDATEAA